MVFSGVDTQEPTRRFRVLVVDDNQDAANTLALLAGFWGCEVRTAYDGSSGLAAARDFQPDCLVLDIAMPGMDGYTLARRLRQQPELALAKYIALSAYSGPDHERRSQEAGFDHCLVKPADPDELERLLNMLQEALRLAEKSQTLAEENIALARET